MLAIVYIIVGTYKEIDRGKNLKKIWIFNHYAMPPEYEVRVRNNKMAHFLQIAGYDVTIFSASTIHNTSINLIEGKEKYIIEKYDDLKFVHIKAPSYMGNGLSRKINMVLFPYRLFKYTKKLNEKPDVIINDLSPLAFSFPFMIAKRYEAKIITEIRDLWPESIIEYGGLKRNSLLAKVLFRVEKKNYVRSDKLVFSMEGGKDYIIEKGWETSVDLDKVHYINNGVDLEEFDFNKKHYKIEDKDLVDNNIFKVIYVGSIRKANQLGLLLDSAKLIKEKGLKQIKLLIWGGGDEVPMLKQRCIDEKIDNVVFKGKVEKKYIPYILSRSNLNILNYQQAKTWKYGGSQNKLFEYLASGKPILANIKIGYCIISKFNCGITGNFSNSDHYLDAIKKIANLNEDDYKIMCNNARMAAEEFDFKELTEKLIEVIEVSK